MKKRSKEGEAEEWRSKRSWSEKNEEANKEAESEKNEEANKLAEAFSNIAPSVSKFLRNLGKISELSQAGDPENSESFDETFDEFEEEEEDIPEGMKDKICRENANFWVPTATGGIKLREGQTLESGVTKKFIINNCLEKSGINTTLGNIIDLPISSIEGIIQRLVNDSLDMVKAPLIKIISWV